ncbi:hypothetical protein FV242_17560 [Methylobacterium sp. WL64]|uniref:hypothetical protein n=1 Tax=Methylobacterium sp. WL64 TaxID=2603894 RepID=UPI0011CA3BA0|nr:hypothetical protein [Methylobacterium sp. WL64]TXN01686.1 hypothetical protein FV242_17560 [Methylobacterium sp. WL64]
MASASGRILTGAEVKALSQRSDLRGAMRLGAHVLMLAGSGWLVWRSGPWTLLPAMLLLGRDCQEFRVGAAIVDPKEVPDGTTQSTPRP